MSGMVLPRSETVEPRRQRKPGSTVRPSRNQYQATNSIHLWLRRTSILASVIFWVLTSPKLHSLELSSHVLELGRGCRHAEPTAEADAAEQRPVQYILRPRRRQHIRMGSRSDEYAET